jgi:cyclopropane fatty-acyl-phospholipid synthase-like methyltransferase
MENNDFNESYKGTPPWDIGRPQKEFVLLEQRGEIEGSILDVGCGTGENSLFFAGHGHEVLGVDFSELAIQKARKKATDQHLEHATFQLADALNLASTLGKASFDNVIDCGLFHAFTDPQRVQFVEGLHFVLKPGGKYFMLCFSNFEPPIWGGPRRVGQKEIEASFSRGWKINYIQEARFETNFHTDGGRAWLSSVSRLPDMARR